MRQLYVFLVFLVCCVGLSAQQPGDSTALANALDAYLTSTHGGPYPLASHGPTFVSEGSQYSVNPRFLVAISGAETSFGSHICANDNAFNWFWHGACHDSPFDTWDEGIHTVAHYMQKSYILHGYTTINAIAGKYCTSGCEHWIPNVDKFYSDLGGTPSAEVIWTGDPAGTSTGSVNQGSGNGTGTGEQGTSNPPVTTTPPSVPTLSAALKNLSHSGSFFSSDHTLTFTVVATAQNLGTLTPHSVLLLADEGATTKTLSIMNLIPGTDDSSTPQYQATVSIPESSIQGKTLDVQMKLRNGSSKKTAETLHAGVSLPSATASHTLLIVLLCSFGGLLLLGGIGFAVAHAVRTRKAQPTLASSAK